VTYLDQLQQDPTRHDFFWVMRRLERFNHDRPRIGDTASLREEYITLGQDPYFAFPSTNLTKAESISPGRMRVLVQFLGLLGPQGALPLTTTEEAFSYLRAQDDAFPRFLDLFNSRFLQLFYRAWAESRPIVQNDRPRDDRFKAYMGAHVGLGSGIFLALDSVADSGKLSYAGLMGPQAKSASRLGDLVSGLFGVDAEVEQFVGLRLVIPEGERTRIGAAFARLGQETLLGASIYSVQDKVRLSIKVASLQAYEHFLPTGKQARRLADIVFFYLGAQYDWDVELLLPETEATPVRLGQAGKLGWTSWVAPRTETDEVRWRADARFHLAERFTVEAAAKQKAPRPARTSRSTKHAKQE
jgi:type VI secretion system protein ImpH